MSQTQQKANGKRAYQQIDLWKRKELIQCVINKEETMKDCAKRLGINYCTAKHIMKVYRRSGSYETDLMRKKKQRDQELRERVLNDTQFADFAHNKESMTSQKDQDESTHGVGSNEHSQALPACQVMPTMVENSCLSPNFLFENFNMDFSSSQQVEFRYELQNLCRSLGDRVFATYSF